MDETRKFTFNSDQAELALAAPGAAAFAAIKQLLVELEPIVGPDGVERIRAKAKQALTATALPEEYLAAIGSGLD